MAQQHSAELINFFWKYFYVLASMGSHSYGFLFVSLVIQSISPLLALPFHSVSKCWKSTGLDSDFILFFALPLKVISPNFMTSKNTFARTFHICIFSPDFSEL